MINNFKYYFRSLSINSTNKNQRTTGFASLLPKGQQPLKAKPMFMLHDKEQLYDEAIKLKQNMNVYKDENNRLKTRVLQFEKELERKDKIIQELLSQANNQGSSSQTRGGQRMSTETHLVAALKKQIRDMKDEIRQKEEEAKKFRKNLKITKIQETEVEIKMFSDECTRLKHIIEEIVKQKSVGYTPQEVAAIEDKINQQAMLLKKIKQENTEMATVIQKKEEETNNWKEVANKLSKKVSRMEVETKENIKVRKNVTDTKKELQKLKDQLSSLKSNNKDKESAAYKSRIDELLRKQSELNDKLEQKEKKIKTLESKLAETSSNPAKDAERNSELESLKLKAKECIFITRHIS